MILISLKIYDSTMRLQESHGIDHNVNLGGFNLVLDYANNSVGQNHTLTELTSVNYIKKANKMLSLCNCYRKLEQSGGYTWTRGSTAS